MSEETNVPETKVKEIIAVIQQSVTQLQVNKLETAQTLLWAKNVINYEYTDEGSFHQFCTAHVNMGHSTISYYIAVATLVEKFNYSNKECKQIIESIGWTKFYKGLVYSKRKMTVTGFIKKFHKIATTNTACRADPNSQGDRGYTYSLPAEEADKLDGYLYMFGMTENDKGHRRGVREAMIEFIRNIVD